MSDFVSIFLIWGGWLLLPLLIDVVPIIMKLISAYIFFRRMSNTSTLTRSFQSLPKLSVIIPVYNAEDTIEACLLSVFAQSYPHQKIQILIVNDGSSDNTKTKILNFIENKDNISSVQTGDFIIRRPLKCPKVRLINRLRETSDFNGKPQAVNAALAYITGQFIITIDADCVLNPNAFHNTMQHFSNRPKLIAATGHLIIDSTLSSGKGVNTDHEIWEISEYILKAHLDRPADDLWNGMFSLSGAFIAYQADIFIDNGGYNSRTLSEDADMTLNLHKQADVEIGYMHNVTIYIPPSKSVAELRKQRIRWYRGGLEVLALHLEDKPGHRFLFWHVVLNIRVIRDHTLMLPRLLWLLILVFLPFMGYDWKVFVLMPVSLVLINMLILLLQFTVAIVYSTGYERDFLRRYLHYSYGMVFYYFWIFYISFMSNYITLSEEQSW